MRTIATLSLLAILAAACSPVIPAGEYHSMLIPTYDPAATPFSLPTAIPSPAPLPTIALDPAWPLPHADDFNDPDSGWEIGVWDTGTLYNTNGTYQVTSLGDAYFMWGEPYMNFGDVVMEVDAAQVSGPESNNTGYGFFCRRNGDRRFQHGVCPAHLRRWLRQHPEDHRRGLRVPAGMDPIGCDPSAPGGEPSAGGMRGGLAASVCQRRAAGRGF